MTPTPATGAAAELPTDAWRYQDSRSHFRYRGYRANFDVEYAILKPVALTLRDPAQSQLDALREEVARLTHELENVRAEGALAAGIALKAQPSDVDALMALAQDFANAHAMAFYADPELEPDSDEIAGRMKFADAAREALRAKLAVRKEEL